MGKPRGFIEVERVTARYRDKSERLADWSEFELAVDDPTLRGQASRCMDCGIPFCHGGCPLGNLIPDWNDWIYQGRSGDAARALYATNNFPEVTGRICPAPCEAACVLNIDKQPVTIKTIEREIADRTFEEMLKPQPSLSRSGKKVAIVGSGPAGLACAQQLARVGHDVTVYEKADRVGGLLRYGIPDFKLSKDGLDARVAQLEAEGVVFKTGVDVGVSVPANELFAASDALVLCGGAMIPRDLPVPGRELAGVHFAMDFLTQQNRRVAGLGDELPPEFELRADGLDVIVIGGGDTGSDCVGTSLRQGARSVTSLELMPRPPDERVEHNPWPEWPLVYRTSSSHEEGGERKYSILTKAFLPDERGHVRALQLIEVKLENGRFVEVPGTEREIPAQLVLLAMGFTGPVRAGMLEDLGVAMDARGNVSVLNGATSVSGIFAAGDMSRGQSLVVWAIAEGRRAAERVHRYLQSGDRILSSRSA